ncbi:hypothetical protein Micbo1qcDRAFT_1230 [Microdochium bolleyi]|uniref:Uncharacterized protein n=1 Tax=Microdochium bolleyi TaxID=196109 RepID=A0A136JHA3_9PEZI|nr:hypothetical protein Micbo1qcDRAFT_1230 [Microdochium bolleyi]
MEATRHTCCLDFPMLDRTRRVARATRPDHLVAVTGLLSLPHANTCDDNVQRFYQHKLQPVDDCKPSGAYSWSSSRCVQDMHSTVAAQGRSTRNDIHYLGSIRRGLPRAYKGRHPKPGVPRCHRQPPNTATAPLPIRQYPPPSTGKVPSLTTRRLACVSTTLQTRGLNTSCRRWGTPSVALVGTRQVSQPSCAWLSRAIFQAEKPIQLRVPPLHHKQPIRVVPGSFKSNYGVLLA